MRQDGHGVPPVRGFAWLTRTARDRTMRGCNELSGQYQVPPEARHLRAGQTASYDIVVNSLGRRRGGW